MKMKVLQVVKTNEGATWAFTQALWLSNNGVDITTVLPSLNGGMAEKYKEHNMKIRQGSFELPIKKPWQIKKNIKEINKLVKEVNPDVIHCHFVTNILMLRIALRDSKIPRIFQVPGPLHLESKFFRNVEIKLATNIDYWVGACKRTCEIYLENNISEEKVHLSYYGGYGGNTIEEYKFNSRKINDEYNISTDKTLVGMVSYFYKPKIHLMQQKGLKGHEDFIDAIAIAREKNPSIIGVIIGGAWGNAKKYEHKVKEYALKKCGKNIVFTGFRNDIKEIYRNLDIAVHPSHSENLGGAAESLAAGVPTITTNVGGFPDIVINGETGFTVNKKEPQELAKAIIKMTNNYDEALEMARIGTHLVRDLLDIENSAKKMLRIYSKVTKISQIGEKI